MVSRISAAGDALGRPRQTDARRLDGAQQQAPGHQFLDHHVDLCLRHGYAVAELGFMQRRAAGVVIRAFRQRRFMPWSRSGR